MNEKPMNEHRALATSDDDNPRMNRAWCSCGWRAKQADYGLADAWRRADAHKRAAERGQSKRVSA